MVNIFDVVTEEFVDDLNAIRSLVLTFSGPTQSSKSRIAAANSATLLVAATFEEFVREMARSYARAVVASCPSFSHLPAKMASIAWKRTMDDLAKVKFDGVFGVSMENIFSTARARFSAIYDFCNGDLTKDIYRELIHNENNMRPREINSLFKVSGLIDVCAKASEKTPLLDEFGETEWRKAHGKLLIVLDNFFERRNGIAHALNFGRSSSPDQISADIDMLENFGKALCETLIAVAPPSSTVQPRSDS